MIARLAAGSAGKNLSSESSSTASAMALFHSCWELAFKQEPFPRRRVNRFLRTERGRREILPLDFHQHLIAFRAQPQPRRLLAREGPKLKPRRATIPASWETSLGCDGCLAIWNRKPFAGALLAEGCVLS